MTRLKRPLNSLYIILIVISFLVSSCNRAELKNENKSLPIAQYETIKIVNEDLERKIKIRGNIESSKKISIVSEVQGKTFQGVNLFNEGVSYKKGDVILSIDDTDNLYNLNSSKSKFIGLLNGLMSTIKLDFPEEYGTWERYLNEIVEKKNLPQLPEIEGQKFRSFLISNNFFETYYSIKAQENTLSKHRIIAPFNGTITTTYIKSGDMALPQMKLAEFSNNDFFELEAIVSIQDYKFLKIGQKVVLYSQDLDKEFEGYLLRYNPKIDKQNQSFKVYASINSDEIYEGMYLEGNIHSPLNLKGARIPRLLLKRNNEVNILIDSVIMSKPVNPLFFEDNMVFVYGLNDNTLLVNESPNKPLVGQIAISKNK